MHSLYPDLKPFAVQMLPVGDGHELYVEQCGNPDGLPVVFLHSGPGTGMTHQDRCFFDPDEYHIILFDQRGAGRSRPHASLVSNTTAHLLADLELLRETLKLDSWVLFGSGWGAMLGLLYGQAHPERVATMILSGVALGRDEDKIWLYRQGANRIFPDAWQAFIEHVPEDERGNLPQAYHRQLMGKNELTRMSCAKNWGLWLAHCATLRPSEELNHAYSDPHRALALALIGSHYVQHHEFIEPGQILANMNALDGVPAILVHGRYDMISPLDNALLLQQHWPDAELHIVREAGHEPREPAMIDALVRATQEVAKRLRGELPDAG